MDEIDFAVLQEFVFDDRIFDSQHHGLTHWRQVEFNGLLLAQKTKVNINGVRLFALFHDSKRDSDSYDAYHGPNGAVFFEKCYKEKKFIISDDLFQKIFHAIKNHTTENDNEDLLIGTCYDADRLDLGRVGICPNPSRLVTKPAKEIAKKLQNIPCELHRDFLKNFSF